MMLVYWPMRIAGNDSVPLRSACGSMKPSSRRTSGYAGCWMPFSLTNDGKNNWFSREEPVYPRPIESLSDFRRILIRCWTPTRWG